MRYLRKSDRRFPLWISSTATFVRSVYQSGLACLPHHNPGSIARRHTALTSRSDPEKINFSVVRPRLAFVTCGNFRPHFHTFRVRLLPGTQQIFNSHFESATHIL